MTTNNENIVVKKEKFIPVIEHKLRSKMIIVPPAIYECSGIKVLGKRIKSMIFTTDVAIIMNNNADAVIAVYPFTPQLAVMESVLNVASVPVFTGVGGGPTPIKRSVNMAMEAELKGAHGVVLNAPAPIQMVQSVSEVLDVPVICTVASLKDDFKSKVEHGANILNVSGGKDTAKIVKKIREELGEKFPIIATGGPTDETIRETIKAGANAITYTPPTSAEIFEKVMASYRVDIE